MLELRKGKSFRSYENDFFRILAAGLTAEFDKRGWDGLLIGMPESLELESLQIDCLLVTNDRIVLIDFKDYSGDLELPEQDMFDVGAWKIDEIPVRGGSSVNPYRQLGKQRAKLNKQLGWKMRGFDRKSVYTLVCFHGQINIIGRVPRRIIGFDIVDSTTVFNKIVDIVDVQSDNQNYLTPANRSLFTDKLFSAPEYFVSITTETASKPEEKDEVKPIGRGVADAVITETALPNLEALYMISIAEFLSSQDRVLIISGNTKSGKTRFIPKIRDMAFDNAYIEVPVFAYSNRLKKRMHDSHPEIQEVESLYGAIYDFWNEEVDENYKKTIPVKTITETVEEDLQGKVLYIIDDSQLISNSSLDSEILRFGTGCLLDDFFTYLQLDKYPNRKIIFIGDTSRISYGSKVENPMNPEYLGAFLESKGVKSDIRSLVLPPNNSDSEIVKVCNKLASNIDNKIFNSLLITNTGNVCIVSTKNQTSILKAAYESPMHNKILVYTNEQANQINFWIKKKLAHNGAEIGPGDTIVFNSTTSAYAPDRIVNDDVPFSTDEQPFNFDEPKRIDNGNLATVISVDWETAFDISRDIKGETVRLLFIPCQVKLQDSSLLQIYVLDNYLKANKAELETGENIAYQAILWSCLNEYFSKNKFEDSKEYKEMEAHGDSYYEETEKGLRLARDLRKLTPEEKGFRKRMESRLLHDQTSKYFKVYHAARVKYAWAMTVNKAMAFTFDRVFFNTSQGDSHGRTNKDYYKWLYTGFAIASNSVELINWKTISPFMKTDFNSMPSNTAPKVKQFIFSFSNDSKTKGAEFEDFLASSLLLSGWQVLDVLHRPYLEIVKLRKDEAVLELLFDYNGKGEMKPPRLKSGDTQYRDEVLRLLMNSNVSKTTLASGPTNQCGDMTSFFEELIALISSRGIASRIVKTQEWMAIFEFAKGNTNASVQCWYDSHGMISKFNLINGSESLYSEIVAFINDTYSLEE
ncbi:nuclease-related domain-containing protein [Solidesulfovibrio alcoholivorans]|uniref:nuclease-related domain-containing protein n=1 Tax=Solidesulfovibrio alcoholivorans TaxID=81406 RepID=UPI000695058B|nr:nuclease-related domain-containing protein [Solidesulfovibrio alcoholivorans]